MPNHSKYLDSGLHLSSTLISSAEDMPIPYLYRLHFLLVTTPSEIKTYKVYMKVGIEGIDLTVVTGKQQIGNMYVHYMPYALFPQMIYLAL